MEIGTNSLTVWNVKATQAYFQSTKYNGLWCHFYILTFICLRQSYISYDLVRRTFTAQVRDVSTCVGARVVEGGLGARVVDGGWEPLRKHMCGSAGCGGGIGNQWTKSIRRGACHYSIVVNAHRVTSMADIDIEAVRKQKKAEYNKK
jgi:hypothetical protein